MPSDVDQNEIVPMSSAGARWLWPTIITLSLMATLLFGAMAVLFARHGENFVRRRDDTVGEVLMREGKRLEEGGMPGLALETYERALKARFHGMQNQTFTLERAGILLWGEERLEEAVAALERALERPESTTAPYEGLIDALIQLGRLDEAQRHLEAWDAKISVAASDEEQGKACHTAGKLTEAHGQRREAIRIYEQCVKENGFALSAARLGTLLAEEGEQAKAMFYLERYLLMGAPGEDILALLDVYSWLLRETLK